MADRVLAGELPERGVGDLPVDLLARIMSSLSSSGLADASMVCRRFRSAAADDRQWQRVAGEEFGELPATLVRQQHPEASWKQLFVHTLVSHRAYPPRCREPNTNTN